jgi:DNA-binding transcriptional ArsR family regulator
MNALSFRLGWPLYAGMLVAGAAAVVASASTLATLAHTAGWSSWTPWLLPAALDIGGWAGGWCWLRPGVPEPARRFGRIVALAGAAGSLIGNAAGHLLSTGYLSAGPVLVVIVGAVPAAVLVALAHLAALLAVPPNPMSDAEPGHPGHVRTEQMDDERTDETPGWHADKQADQDERHLTDEQSELDQQRATDERDQAREQDDADERDEIGEQGDAGDREETGEQPDGPDTRDAVLQLLHQHPLTIAELAKATDRSRTTVIGHLTALTRSGAVQRDDTKRYRATTRPHLIAQRNETGPEEAAR